MVWWPCFIFTMWVTLVWGSSSVQENDVDMSGKIHQELKKDLLQRAREELDKDLMELTLNGATSSKSKKTRHTEVWVEKDPVHKTLYVFSQRYQMHDFFLQVKSHVISQCFVQKGFRSTFFWRHWRRWRQKIGQWSFQWQSAKLQTTVSISRSLT